jgi:DNA-binding response OmpR family regulator
MLRAGTTTFAVPTVMIDQVQEYKAAPYAEVASRGEVAWKDNRYPLRSLLPLLGEIDTPTPARQIPVLLLKSGVQRAAIRVDEIIGNREIVVKTIGPQLSRLAGIAGATVLGNGQVVLILNPVQLVHREQPGEAQVTAPPVSGDTLMVDAKSGAALVMVVDDSLTVRKITSRMLTREGFEVATAKDGVDALQQLQDIKPDCILLDVEMPRMDGFEFARNVRVDAKTRSIPIIMITSRTADKHRNHALEIGVNEYMGKPYQEDQLLALIRPLHRRGRVRLDAGFGPADRARPGHLENHHSTTAPSAMRYQAKARKIVVRDVADQRPHRDERREEAHHEPHGEGTHVGGAEQVAVLHHLVAGGCEHDRHREEEREFSGRLAREAEDHPAHDRGPGARRARNEREALREAHLERVAPRHLVDGGHARRAVAYVPALDREDRDRAHHQRDRDAHRVEEVGLDLRLESEAHDGGGHERHREVGGEALLHRIGREARERAREARPILPAHRQDGPQLDHDVEDLALLVVQAQQVGDEDQVARSRRSAGTR